MKAHPSILPYLVCSAILCAAAAQVGAQPGEMPPDIAALTALRDSVEETKAAVKKAKSAEDLLRALDDMETRFQALEAFDLAKLDREKALEIGEPDLAGMQKAFLQV